MGLDFLFVAAFVLAFLISLAANRWLRRWAPRMGLIDWPGERRRLHSRPTAVVGGVGLLVAVGLTTVLVAVGGGVSRQYPTQLAALLPVLGGGVAMCVMGVLDDREKLPSGVKFTLQVAIALTVVAAGVRIASVDLPLVGVVELAAPVSVGVTAFWLVGITNAFNLVDGTDGLAAGAAFTSILAMFVVSLALGHELIALFLGITGAATLGFLKYNFPPASIFLGDSGSQFLGFLLAGVGVVGMTKTTTAVAITVPVVAFGLPVLDTALAIVRRLLRGDSIAKPDRGHIHHRLIDLGHSPRKVVLLLYGVCGAFALASLLSLSRDELVVGSVLGGVLLGIFYGIGRLRIPELLELGRLWGSQGGIRQRISRNVQIRERARDLRREESLDAVFGGLSTALAETEFDEVELWIHGTYLRQIPSAGREITAGTVIEADDEGFVWRWRRDSAAMAREKLIELNAPVLVAEEGVAVEITIRRQMQTKVPGGLAVVSDSLLPATAQALENARSVQVTRDVDLAPDFAQVRLADTRVRAVSG